MPSHGAMAITNCVLTVKFVLTQICGASNKPVQIGNKVSSRWTAVRFVDALKDGCISTMKIIAKKITKIAPATIVAMDPFYSPSEDAPQANSVAVHPAMAKIACPRSANVYVRRRLDGLLDVSLQRGTATFIEGPPGSGKTVAVSSYVDSRDLRCIWYRIDAADGDVSTFFHYFTLAVHSFANTESHPQDALSLAAHSDIAAFSRLYFRQLYGALPPGCLIIIDNYQAVPEDSPLHDVICIAVDEMPEGGHVVLTSRRACPARFSRLRLNGAMSVIHADDLTFTPEEALEMATLSGVRVTPELSAAMDSQLAGWAGGLALLLGRHDGNTVSLDILRKTVDQYFASEIFCVLDEERQDFLMQCAMLPTITFDIASRLVCWCDSVALLRQAVEDHHFLQRVEGDLPRYRFHPLFQHYLSQRAVSRWGATKLALMRREAALMLTTSGEYESAFDLFASHGEWKHAIGLVLTRAPILRDEGKLPLLSDWIARLPAELVQSNAWLIYWHALVKEKVEGVAGTDLFMEAYRRFCAEDELSGLAWSWSHAVNAVIHDYHNLAKLDHWIGEFDRQLRNRLYVLPLALRANVLLALFIAMCVRQPSHPELLALYHQLHQWLNDRNHHQILPLLRQHLVIYHLARGEDGEAEMLLGLFSGAGAAAASASHDDDMALHKAEALYALHAGQEDRCWKSIAHVQANAMTAPIRAHDAALLCLGAAISLNRGDLPRAEQALALFEQQAGRCDAYYAVAAWRKYYLGETAHALLLTKHAAVATDERGAPYFSAMHYVGFGLLSHLCGDTRQALLYMERGRKIGRELANALIEFAYQLFSACIAFDIGKEENAREHLENGMRIGRQRGYLHFMFFPARTVSLLCLRAIESGVETAYVRTLIDHNKFTPDPSWAHAESWPWPIRIYTLGRFAIVKDGNSINHSGKSQKKPLELLKALIAFGGRNVAEAKLADVLWPDADGDAAAQALATTLFRLRKLIGEKVIKRQDGRLTLDSSACWVDCWAFERLSNEAAGIRVTRIASLRKLYQGSFLGDDDDAIWAMPMRERLRAKHARLAI